MVTKFEAKFAEMKAENADIKKENTEKFTKLEAENTEIEAESNEIKKDRNQNKVERKLLRPNGELRMFNTAVCPYGYVEFDRVQGYLLTGRPKGGASGTRFNRAMEVGEESRVATHTHEVNVTDSGHTHTMDVNDDPGHTHVLPTYAYKAVLWNHRVAYFTQVRRGLYLLLLCFVRLGVY